MWAMKLTVAAGLLLSLGLCATAQAGSQKEFKKKWTRCDADADCTVLKLPCQFLCVNQKSIEAVKDFYTPSASAFPCKEPEIWTKPTATCKQNNCSCDIFQTPDQQMREQKKDDNQSKT